MRCQWGSHCRKQSAALVDYGSVAVADLVSRDLARPMCQEHLERVLRLFEEGSDPHLTALYLLRAPLLGPDPAAGDGE